MLYAVLYELYFVPPKKLLLSWPLTYCLYRIYVNYVILGLIGYLKTFSILG